MNNFNFAQLVQDVDEGLEDPLKALAKIKQLKESVELAYKAIYAAAIDEAKKYPENTVEAHGFQFIKKGGTTRYNYKEIPEWFELNAKLKEIEDKHKNAYTTWKKGGTAIDPETGEVIQQPIVTYGADSLTVKPLK